MKPSPHKHLLAGAAVALLVAGVGAARADNVDEATNACKAKTTAAQIGRLLDNNDMRSYRKLVDSKTKVGDCKPLKAHTDVKVDKRDGDLACVKAKGDRSCVWVLETNLRITSERRQPVRQDYIACKTRLYLETGRKILAENDQDAVKRFQIATNQSGQCVALKKAEQVDVERRDDKVFCIRPPGEDQCYWTDSLALPPNISEEASSDGAGTTARSAARQTSRKKK
jgi:hypothetical protein